MTLPLLALLGCVADRTLPYTGPALVPDDPPLAECAGWDEVAVRRHGGDARGIAILGEHMLVAVPDGLDVRKADGRLVHTVPVPGETRALALAGSDAWVAGSFGLARITDPLGRATVHRFGGARTVAVAIHRGRAWGADPRGRLLHVALDAPPGTTAEGLVLPAWPQGLAVGDGGLFVAGTGAGALKVDDEERVTFVDLPTTFAVTRLTARGAVLWTAGARSGVFRRTPDGDGEAAVQAPVTGLWPTPAGVAFRSGDTLHLWPDGSADTLPLDGSTGAGAVATDGVHVALDGGFGRIDRETAAVVPVWRDGERQLSAERLDAGWALGGPSGVRFVPDDPAAPVETVRLPGPVYDLLRIDDRLILSTARGTAELDLGRRPTEQDPVWIRDGASTDAARWRDGFVRAGPVGRVSWYLREGASWVEVAEREAFSHKEPGVITVAAVGDQTFAVHPRQAHLVTFDGFERRASITTLSASPDGKPGTASVVGDALWIGLPAFGIEQLGGVPHRFDPGALDLVAHEGERIVARGGAGIAVLADGGIGEACAPPGGAHQLISHGGLLWVVGPNSLRALRRLRPVADP